MRLGLVVLDTLRFDVSEEVMDLFDGRRGRTFSNCYSTARWTSPAHASLFTGYYPTEVGTYAGRRHLTTGKRTVAERLGAAGYETVAVSNNINVDRFFDFDRGFDTFVRGPDIENRPEENRGGVDWDELESKIADSGIRRPIEAAYHIYRSDAPTLSALKTGFEMFAGRSEDRPGIAWSEPTFDRVGTDRPEDLFFFANFMPCHYPYDPPAGYCDLDPVEADPIEMTLRERPVTDAEHRRYWENYVGAARYLDDALPPLLDRIDWDCLFVLGDHGELFDEYGLYGHQYGVYEELTHVPAMALGSEVPEGTTTAPTSVLDVPRTLLELAGLAPEPEMRGLNLLDDIPGDRAVYAESEGCEWYDPEATGIEAAIPESWADPHYMVRTGDAMYVSDRDGERAFDPSSGADRPDRLAALRERARSIRDGRTDYAGTGADGELPDEVATRLGHLGYR